MRLRPLAFLTFQQFPFFSPFRRFIVIPVIYFIIPSPYNHSSIVPSFIHHPGHPFPHSTSLSSFHSFHPHSSALLTLHRPSLHPRHSHHLSVIPTIFPSHRSVTPSHTAVLNNNCSKIIFKICLSLLFRPSVLPSFCPSAFPFLQSVASSQSSVTPSRYSVIPLSS